jgi:hypothetical protein
MRLALGLTMAVQATLPSNVVGVSCPSSIASPTWTAGAGEGLALAVDDTSGCFTLSVDGELWLASSHLLLSASGAVYRQPYMPGHHELVRSATRAFVGGDALGTFEAFSIMWHAHPNGSGKEQGC